MQKHACYCVIPLICSNNKYRSFEAQFYFLQDLSIDFKNCIWFFCFSAFCNLFPLFSEGSASNEKILFPLSRLRRPYHMESKHYIVLMLFIKLRYYIECLRGVLLIILSSLSPSSWKNLYLYLHAVATFFNLSLHLSF